jgi:hypothetical protein
MASISGSRGLAASAPSSSRGRTPTAGDGSAGLSPCTRTCHWTSCSPARSRNRPGMSAGLPAPTSTTSTPASIAPRHANGSGNSILRR